jgi:hypothetical protein
MDIEDDAKISDVIVRFNALTRDEELSRLFAGWQHRTKDGKVFSMKALWDARPSKAVQQTQIDCILAHAIQSDTTLIMEKAILNIFPLASWLNNSCMAFNAVHSHHRRSGRLNVVAVCKIAAGTEIRIPYIRSICSREDEMRKLRRRWHTHCLDDCRMCNPVNMDDLETINNQRRVIKMCYDTYKGFPTKCNLTTVLFLLNSVKRLIVKDPGLINFIGITLVSLLVADKTLPFERRLQLFDNVAAAFISASKQFTGPFTVESSYAIQQLVEDQRALMLASN